MSQCWTVADIPDLRGKVAVITGGNLGLGFQSGLALANAGCRLVIACRNLKQGRQAAEQIGEQVLGADVEVIPLDLTCIESIRAFCSHFSNKYQRLDILLNNAGVVNLESLQHTQSGREVHFATNHLGHFSLTGLLLPTILATPQSRVVTVSSGAHKFGEIDFDDLDWHQRPYNRMKAYGDSKLANLLFSFQLQRYFERHKADAMSLAAHPGLTGTARQQSIGVGGWLAKWIASPVEQGVLPQLRACCDPHAKGGQYYGPRFNLRGKPTINAAHENARSQSLAEVLWNYSVETTAVDYIF